MSEINRREVLQIMGATSALAFTWTEADAEQAAEKTKQARKQAAASKQPYKPQFFTPHEYATVVMLADIIIPKDERSGSASEAAAPQFIDFIVGQQPERQTALRGGLAWLDTECRHRFDKNFIDGTDAQRTQVLEDVAWPTKARPEMSHGVRFFNTIRDLVATGFWSSKMGVEDLGYQGNTFVAEWKGAPETVLKKLGVSYDTP